jgi:hypothetical protein
VANYTDVIAGIAAIISLIYVGVQVRLGRSVNGHDSGLAVFVYASLEELIS